MFDLVTNEKLKTELSMLEIKFEWDLHKLEAKLEAKLGAYTLAIIGAVIASAVSLHLWK
jgi:hypothetical protein